MTATVRKDLREIVALAIEAAGLGDYVSGNFTGSESWPIFWRKMPESPDQCVVVTCYGLGGSHEQGVQVRVRGSQSDSTTAEDHADAIRTALHGLENITRGGTTLKLLSLTSTAELGSDVNGRDQLAVNFRAVTDDPNTRVVD